MAGRLEQCKQSELKSAIKQVNGSFRKIRLCFYTVYLMEHTHRYTHSYACARARARTRTHTHTHTHTHRGGGEEAAAVNEEDLER